MPWKLRLILLQYVLALLVVALYITANGVMWWAHSRALIHCDNTLQPVVLNSSANFVLTVSCVRFGDIHLYNALQGILGLLLFAEIKSLYWWSGLGLIVFGTYLLGSTSRQEQEKKER